MRLIELFGSKAVKLGIKATTKAEIIDQLVELQATHGNITDKEAYKKAIYAREEEFSTFVGNGIVVPHARGSMVTAPSLAVVTLAEPVKWNEDDDGKANMFFMIAAPENGSLHMDMLARMMTLLANEAFVAKLNGAKTVKEFLELMATRPDIKLGICGEHGGDPSSVEFCHKVGLDYVSCSPFRVPIARLAAAQAAIKESK